jgi:hypothetical protein
MHQSEHHAVTDSEEFVFERAGYKRLMLHVYRSCIVCIIGFLFCFDMDDSHLDEQRLFKSWNKN